MNHLQPFEIPLSGVNLIEASAGTGKTYNIASLYVRALLERDIEVKDILVVTYTEAATKELRDRLMVRLRESVHCLEGRAGNKHDFLEQLTENVDESSAAIVKLKKAIRSFDEASVYTIHGFCYQALQEQAFESRALFEAELIGDDTEVIRQLIDDYWRNWVEEASRSSIKRPLLKYLMDKGYRPDTLTEEVGDYLGKPYLKVIPDKSDIQDKDQKLIQLSELFDQLRREWNSSREELFELLNAGHLTYYRTDWLQGWMVQMHDWINAEVPPLELFDKFEKFVQSSIDGSLKKASEKKGIKPPQHHFFQLAESYRNVAKSLQSFDISFKLNLFQYLRDELVTQKEELQVLSYDDLLIRLRDALTDSERGKRLVSKLQKSYPMALVDEFQDTDPIQYEIFKSIYGNHTRNSALFMIGDPKQSIYSFRGADIFAYLQAKEDALPGNTFSLDKNFRSVPILLNAINVLFNYQDHPFILENIPFHPVEPGRDNEDYEYLKVNGKRPTPITFRATNNDSDELPLNKGEAQELCARDTASQIARLLNQAEEGKAKIGGEPVGAADIAVLVRSHYQADLVRNALHKEGINCVQYSQDSVFDSEEANELQFILKAVAEPANEGLVKTALATNTMGYNARELLELSDDEFQWVAKLEQFSAWHNLWQTRGFGYMFRQLLKDEGIAKKLIQKNDGERKLTNLVHLSELLQKKEKDGKTGTRSLLQWLARKRSEETKDLEEEQLRLESDENLVRVVTMHRSKGLEYPIVYCPFLWHGAQYTDGGEPLVYHDPDDPSRVYLDFHGKDDPDRNGKRYLKAKEALAESVRLAYVAITRAEQQCIVSWVQAQKTEYSPLGYLLLGPAKSLPILEQTISSEGSYSPVDPDTYRNSLEQLINRHPSLFSLERSSLNNQEQLQFSAKGNPGLKARSFQRSNALLGGSGISSFSSLIQNKEVEFEIEYELYDEPTDENTPKYLDEKNLNIFNFPKGPGPGTAVHHIFEELDFNDPQNLEKIAKEKLESQNIDRRWTPVISGQIRSILTQKLKAVDHDVCLSEIEPGNLIPEMEFYVTSAQATLHGLLGIIRPESEQLPALSGYSEEGYLKGFIDLTFKHNGRYYILDYKTNHLGDSISDYAFEQLHQKMKLSLYDLQYHIYVLALHRYLQKADPTYTYEQHFGGAFYLYIRGMNKGGQEGIYFDRPAYSRIQKLERYLQREKIYE